MSKTLLPLLALAVLLASPVAADSIAIDFPVAANAVISTGIEPGQTVGDTDGSDSTIPLFDPLLGVLTGWQIAFEGTYSIRIAAEALGTAPADPVAVDFSGAAGFGLTVLALSGPLAVGDVGPFSTPIALCSGTGSCSASILAAATGPVAFVSALLDPSDAPAGLPFLHVTTTVTTTVGAASGWQSIATGTGAELLGTGTVTYFYTPEPGAGVLVALGIASLAGPRRRRGPVGG